MSSYPWAWDLLCPTRFWNQSWGISMPTLFHLVWMPCMRMPDPRSKRTEGPYMHQRDILCFYIWTNSNESVGKGMVRWEGSSIHSGRWKFGNESASSRAPECETCGVAANMRLIVKKDRIKLGSLVIPFSGGRVRHDDDGQAIESQVYVLPVNCDYVAPVTFNLDL